MKLAKIIFILGLICSLRTVTVQAAETEIKVVVNGKILEMDQPPVTRNGKVLVPVRAIAEALYGEVSAKGDYCKVYFKDGDTYVHIYFSDGEILYNNPNYKDGESVLATINMNPKPIVLNGRTLIGIRDLATSFGATTNWDGANSTVYINKSVWAYEYPKVTNNYNKTANLTKIDVKSTLEDIEVQQTFSDGRVIFDLFCVDNQYVATEISTEKIIVEYYDNDFNNVQTKEVKHTLDNIGGVHYSKEGFFYVVFTNDIEETEPNKESIRVVKYDKNFNEVGRVSLSGAVTRSISPLEAGSLRMADNGNRLAINTARHRFKSEDGINHQSNYSMVIDTDKMEVVNSSDDFPINHVSHSFSQYVFYEGDNITFLEVGDGYPRDVIMKYTDGNYENIVEEETIIQSINGETGDNNVGFYISDAIQTDTSYIIFALSLNQEMSYYAKDNPTNAYIYTVDKTTREVTKKVLTNNTDEKGIIYSGASITKISDNKYVILFNVYDRNLGEHIDTKYFMVDSAGKQITEPTSIGYVPIKEYLSPVYKDGYLIWYSTEIYQEDMAFFKLKVN